MKFELYTLFIDELRPVLEGLETTRKKAAKITLIGAIVTLIVTLIAYSLFDGKDSDEFAVLIGLIVAVIFERYFRHHWDQYRSSYKNIVMNKLLTLIAPSLVYSEHNFIKESHYNDSGLFPSDYTIYEGEDHVKGMLGKTEIEFSDIHTQREKSDKELLIPFMNKKRYVTHFEGLLFIADSNKHIPTPVYILSRGLSADMPRYQGVKVEMINLEDVSFNSRFTVYGHNQVDARYIVSPALMQRLTEFSQRSGSNVRLSYSNNKLTIALATKSDYFEPKLFKKATKMAVYQEIMEDLIFLAGIVEDLDLNTRIWTKE